MLYKFISLFVFALCLAGFQTVRGQEKITKLFEVRIIFVEPVADTVKNVDFNEQLKAELKRVGFGITQDRKEADAILELKEFNVEVTLDGGPGDFPKLFYGFELTSPAGAVIWKKKVKFLDKTAADDDKIASQKIADELYNDFRKSLKKKRK